MKELYARREVIAAALFGAAVAGIVWGPVIIRPFRASHGVDVHALRLPEERTVADVRGTSVLTTVAKAKPTGPIDINHADAAALQRLPGIGPRLAERIVAYRSTHGPFTGIHGLLDVDGIGPKRFDRIEPWITAR